MSNTFVNIPSQVTVKAMPKLLARAQAAEIIQKFGQVYNIGEKSSDTASFRRYNALPALTSPAVEGVTPSSQPVIPTTITATADQWISHVQYTDKMRDMVDSDFVSEFGQIVMDQQMETREVQAWNGVKAGTSVIYANGTTRVGVNTALTLGKVQAAVRFLRAQRAKFITQVMASSPNYATFPVEPAYVALCSSDLDRDIRALTGFQPVAAYGSQKTVSDFELGKVENVRFVTHPVFSAFANAGAAYNASFVCTGNGAIDVYPIAIFGMDAFGHTALRGINAAKLMITNPGTPSDSDPAGQRGHITAKSYYKFVRLNELWMTRIECAATAL